MRPCQIGSLDVPHRNEHEPVLLGGVEDGNDVAVIDGRDHSALLEEALSHLAVSEELRSDGLERDSPP